MIGVEFNMKKIRTIAIALFLLLFVVPVEARYDVYATSDDQYDYYVDVDSIGQKRDGTLFAGVVNNTNVEYLTNGNLWNFWKSNEGIWYYSRGAVEENEVKMGTSKWQALKPNRPYFKVANDILYVILQYK